MTQWPSTKARRVYAALLSGRVAAQFAMVRISISVVILMTIGLSANGQTSPAEFRERLETFVGSWTVLGREDTFSEKCEWYHNKSFIVCNSEEAQPQGVFKGVSVLGYSELTGSRAGFAFREKRSVNGGAWVLAAEVSYVRRK